MIVSHRHRFIFFAVPKTATQSIRHFLTPHLGEADWQQQALYQQDLAPIPELAQLGHGHISAAQAAKFLPDGCFDEYFKFAFVRHPIERFISACHFLFRDDPAFVDDPLAMMKTAFSRDRFRQRILIRPQAEMLSINNQLAMDFIGRYEQLQNDFRQVLTQLSISPDALPTLNRSTGGSAAMLDAQLLASLKEFYQTDFAAFNY